MANNNGKYPLLFWGTPESVGAWTGVNGIVVSASNDPWGAASGYAKLADDQANQANPGYIEKTITCDAAQEEIYLMVQRGSVYAATGILWWRDTTAGATRKVLRITWATSAIAHLSGTDTGYDKVWVVTSDNWCLIRLSVAGIVTGNTNVLRFLPAAASETDGTLTGSARLYLRPVIVLGRPLEDPKAYALAPPGSELIVGGGGTQDAFIERGGTFEYFLEGGWRLIPPEEVAAAGDGPNAACSGWNGTHPYTAVNPGIEKMLLNLWQQNTVRFVPDRDDLTAYRDAYLLRPRLDEPPEVERWVLSSGLRAMRQLQLVLRSSADTPFVGY